MLGISANSVLSANRRTSLGWLVFLALISSVLVMPLYAGGMPRAQKHEVRHEIDHLEELWRSAILKSDTTSMGSLLADDYIAITASGALQTKDQTLANLRSGRVRFTSLDISDRKVRFYGTTAVVTSTAAAVVSNGESDLAGSYRYTRVYVRDPRGEWKIVSFEASRVRQPAEKK